MRAGPVLTVTLMAGLLLPPGSVWAQEPPSAPPTGDFALPVEFDFDFGASNGRAVIGRFLPLLEIPIGNGWRLHNLTQAVVALAPGGVPGGSGNPNPVPGPRVFGLGDLLDAVFLTPPSGPDFLWGFGPGLGLPTATDARLGSGKWSAGPAIRLTYRRGPWNLGMLAVDLGSFAGDSERGNVHQMQIRGLVRRQLPRGWYFTYSPIITANWNQTTGQRWLVPVGGGFGKRFDFGPRAIAVSVQAYGNVVRPEGAPTSVFRMDFVLPIPRAFGR